VQAVVVIAALVGAPASVVGAVLVVSVLLSFWALGHLQAEIALNPYLDEVGRARWRIALASVPGALALYWLLHVRPDER
jgi:hypothetical protein